MRASNDFSDGCRRDDRHIRRRIRRDDRQIRQSRGLCLGRRTHIHIRRRHSTAVRSRAARSKPVEGRSGRSSCRRDDAHSGGESDAGN